MYLHIPHTRTTTYVSNMFTAFYKYNDFSKDGHGLPDNRGCEGRGGSGHV